MRALVEAVRRTGPIWRRRERRYFLLTQLERLGIPLRFRRDGFRWRGFSWDRDVSWGMFVHGGPERPKLTAVLDWLDEQGAPRSGGVCVNVGANIGTVALPLARDRSCRVVAIEPSSENFDLLLANVRDNGMESAIDCVQAAVADAAGTVSLLLPPRTSGGAELVRSVPRPDDLDVHQGERRTVSGVRAEPLSVLLSEQDVDPSGIRLVWSDTQGSEGHVISTAPELWASGVPLVIELWPAGLRHQGTFEIVADAGSHGFSEFIDVQDLVSGARERRPISELRGLMESMPRKEQRDVLLIPSRFRYGSRG